MSATRWTLRDNGPALIERGYDSNRSYLAVYKNGVQVAVTSGTYTLTDAGGAELFTTSSLTADGLEIYAAVPSLDNVGFSARLRETWEVVINGGNAPTFRRDAWLVRSILRPVVTVDDLARRHSDIRSLVEGGDAAIESYIIEAWATINADLIKRGKRPNLIMESWALRSLHVYRALALFFADLATRFAGTDRYAALAELYEGKADDEWSKNIRFEYDSDEDGAADMKAAGSNVLVLTAGNMGGPRRSRW